MIKTNIYTWTLPHLWFYVTVDSNDLEDFEGLLL